MWADQVLMSATIPRTLYTVWWETLLFRCFKRSHTLASNFTLLLEYKILFIFVLREITPSLAAFFAAAPEITRSLAAADVFQPPNVEAFLTIAGQEVIVLSLAN